MKCTKTPPPPSLRHHLPFYLKQLNNVQSKPLQAAEPENARSASMTRSKNLNWKALAGTGRHWQVLLGIAVFIHVRVHFAHQLVTQDQARKANDEGGGVEAREFLPAQNDDMRVGIA